ncbi:3-isopropylmalate dehydratase large subunit [Rhizobium rhizogenes]|uniref:3-isopropylmalate dehydratase large subunit n=1 Tax=Rhizobium rhizogenes TaxID=359 RepID=UPI0015729887|nr:3-isopropylmalate dehydratase large subunit [Rhizobium rhizogenes]NTI78523.1 3-isopropylmalate dehydratase large subunit [Rhizobium rhizogenes]
MREPRPYFDKIWERHLIHRFDDDRYLVHIDRHMVHEGTSREAFDTLRQRNMTIHNTDLTFAVLDHVVSTMPGRTSTTYSPAVGRIEALRNNCREFGVRMLDLDDPRQGIAHVVAPEQGIALPGATLVCGDSHTATCGGVGAWAWGIGTTEVAQVMAAQALIVKKPKTMRVVFDGKLLAGLFPKDLILALIGTYGVAAGTGFALEYAGPAIAGMGIEGRMTICNMSIEFGARSGLVAPDETTINYLEGRPFAPKGRDWETAREFWLGLRSDDDAVFDRELHIDCDTLAPQISWGTSPQDVIGVDARVPSPSTIAAHQTRQGLDSALQYMGLEAGQAIEGIPIDFAFIGSCTNGRLSDLVDAAEIAKGRKVASGVKALVVPGSMQVRAAAEAMGLHTVFLEAGFEWRNAGCSMCVAANEDVVPQGKRCVSTSNRNFENRQGAGSRTHLASPAMVAAAAVSGHITDVRKLIGGCR